MTRPNLQEELITSGDIADLLGVGRAAVSNWKKRHPSFPEPAFVDSTGRVRLYWREDVDAWIVEHFGGRAEGIEARAAQLEQQAEQMRRSAERLRAMGGTS